MELSDQNTNETVGHLFLQNVALLKRVKELQGHIQKLEAALAEATKPKEPQEPPPDVAAG